MRNKQRKMFIEVSSSKQKGVVCGFENRRNLKFKSHKILRLLKRMNIEVLLLKILK